MRQIKYRGKTKNGEWLYGDLLQVANEVFIAPSDGDWFDFIPWSRNNVFHLPAAKYAVIPDTVGQFTGLCDKNGRDIYEGDIVKTRRYGVVNGCCNSQGTDKFIVKYMDAQFYIENNLRHFYLQDSKCNEIIGNIHDNPELLNR